MALFSRGTFALFALLLTFASCSDASGPGSSRLGRYTLRKINGADLPGIVAENSVAKLEFLSGALRLNTDGSFTDSMDLKVIPLQGGDIRRLTDVASGSFTISKDTVYFHSVRIGEEYHMVFQTAGSLTQELGGSILVYRK